MSDREWEEVKAEQLKRYYWPIQQPVPIPEPPARRPAPTQEVVRPARVRRRSRAIDYTEEEDVF
jgi:hypothetical protein